MFNPTEISEEKKRRSVFITFFNLIHAYVNKSVIFKKKKNKKKWCLLEHCGHIF
jgi:hypothetical protein